MFSLYLSIGHHEFYTVIDILRPTSSVPIINNSPIHLLHLGKAKFDPATITTGSPEIHQISWGLCGHFEPLL